MILDLRDAFLSRVHGDITAVYTWISFEDDHPEDSERALVLIPFRRSRPNWFIVRDNILHEWDDSTKAGTELCIKKAAHACNVLGLEPTSSNVYRISKIIIEGALDLIRMPNKRPMPAAGSTVGETKIMADGKLIDGFEIKSDHLKVNGLVYG